MIENDARYLHYLLRTDKYITEFKCHSTGIIDSRLRLYPDEFLRINIILPPLSDQKAIATFLDRETSRIDALVEKKQQFIELLEERRSALISHAVTRGLDPDVPMKDSGIEWIGEIPEHWDVRKTSRSFKIIGSGTTPYSDTLEYYDNGDIPWILTGDLNDTILKNTSKKITNSALVNHSSLKLYNKNTLIIAMYGATIGKVSLIDFQGCTNQACCALNKSDYFIQRFVYYWFLTNRNNIIRLSYGGGQPNISQEIIKSLKIQSPPLQEQQAIANYLDRETSQIDNLIEKTKQSIEYLKEYRTALISSAVTGKIDVRGTVSD
jgi:type I restriction enzyme S subunit